MCLLYASDNIVCSVVFQSDAYSKSPRNLSVDYCYSIAPERVIRILMLAWAPNVMRHTFIQ